MSTAVMNPAANDGQRLAPQDMFRSLKMDAYDEARRRGLTLTAWLDREMTDADPKEGLDGFQRLLASQQIVTRTHPRGYYRAAELDVFTKSDATRALFPEWLRRTVENVSHRVRKQQRAVYLSDDTAINTILHPYSDDPTPRTEFETEPPIPLEQVVARTRFVDSDKARALYLNYDAAQLRQKRVSEAAEIPRAKLTTGERNNPLYKYGIALETSYEVLRRVQLDEFAFFLMELALQAEIDKVGAALDVMVNGDANSGTAATSYNLTTLDSAATAGTLTLKGWMSFKAKFKNGYMLTHVLAREAMILQLLLLNVGTANVQLSQRPDLGGFTPINYAFADGVRWGITDDAPANQIVGYYQRRALGRLVETGSQIQEQDRWITRQVNVLTATENEGFETLDKSAVKILVVNA